MFFLFSIASYGWHCELVEREDPSPAEWRWFTRSAWRAAFIRLNPDYEGYGLVDWVQVGREFRICKRNLEDPDMDGKGLKYIEDVEGGQDVTMVPGVERVGIDISDKSYAWKAGYFKVLMGSATAAEYLDDMVLDKTQRVVFPKEFVIGPSNPNPRPCPPGTSPAPLEENCERPYPPPETFYMRILAGKGFTTRQRLDAAIGYGNWLDIKQTPSAAAEFYEWAVDIAASAIPSADLAIDTKTYILKEASSTQATSNLLRATTALATHYARNGNVASALPIFLSVLRARRSAPLDQSTSSLQHTNDAAPSDGTVYNFLRTFIRDSTYPVETTTGDEPLSRSAQPDCAEAELMLYIGEIMFATAGPTRPEDGIGWTKQAVELAQSGLAAAKANSNGGKKAAEAVQRCNDCLTTGVENWSKMVARLAEMEESSKDREGVTSAAGWKGWFGLSSGEELRSTTDRWVEEARVVEELRTRLIREEIWERMASAGRIPGSSWIG